MTVAQTDRYVLASRVKENARGLGFDLVGIASAEPSKYRDYYRQWLDDGQAGTMQYLHKRFDERTDPNGYMSGVRSVICVAMNYYANLDTPSDLSSHGKVARYALGDDYHEVIKRRLHQLADWLRAEAPDAETRCAVDTAPVMEKELSACAGVGWIGKNTCLINEGIGSWLLLGEVLTSLDLPVDQPGIDRCGTCRRCLDACPTQAITAPYQLDARKCISYLTIEHRGEIEPSLQPMLSGWVYGCDICQEVCPWNHKAPITTDPALQPRLNTGTLDLDEVQNWTSEDYRTRLKNSAMKRVKLPILQRNARIVRQNQSGG
jgi:epoxyqueuosine reductase